MSSRSTMNLTFRDSSSFLHIDNRAGTPTDTPTDPQADNRWKFASPSRMDGSSKTSGRTTKSQRQEVVIPPSIRQVEPTVRQRDTATLDALESNQLQEPHTPSRSRQQDDETLAALQASPQQHDPTLASLESDPQPDAADEAKPSLLKRVVNKIKGWRNKRSNKRETVNPTKQLRRQGRVVQSAPAPSPNNRESTFLGPEEMAAKKEAEAELKQQRRKVSAFKMNPMDLAALAEPEAGPSRPRNRHEPNSQNGYTYSLPSNQLSESSVLDNSPAGIEGETWIDNQGLRWYSTASGGKTRHVPAWAIVNPTEIKDFSPVRRSVTMQKREEQEKFRFPLSAPDLRQEEEDVDYQAYENLAEYEGAEPRDNESVPLIEAQKQQVEQPVEQPVREKRKQGASDDTRSGNRSY